LTGVRGVKGFLVTKKRQLFWRIRLETSRGMKRKKAREGRAGDQRHEAKTPLPMKDLGGARLE